MVAANAFQSVYNNLMGILLRLGEVGCGDSRR
jgi:hypothetical protein